jgi:hypothetical protein
MSKQIIIDADHLKAPIVVSGYTESGNLSFFELRKSDNTLCKMFDLLRSPSRRPLSLTNLIERLRELRASAILSAWEALERTDDVDHNIAALGLDPIDTVVSSMHLSKLPAFVAIQAPPVGDVKGIDLNVLCELSCRPLSVELCEHVLEYLKCAFHHQVYAVVAVPPAPLKRPSCHRLSGISWDAKRQKFRSFNLGRTKYFGSEIEAQAWQQGPNLLSPAVDAGNDAEASAHA